MNDFLKLNGNTNNFFKESVSLGPTYYTVVIVFLGGYRKEVHCIERPWPYISKLKRNPKVKTAYIKED